MFAYLNELILSPNSTVLYLDPNDVINFKSIFFLVSLIIITFFFLFFFFGLGEGGGGLEGDGRGFGLNIFHGLTVFKVCWLLCTFTKHLKHDGMLEVVTTYLSKVFKACWK